MTEKLLVFAVNHLWGVIALLASALFIAVAKRFVTTRERAKWLEEVCEGVFTVFSPIAKTTPTKLDDLVVSFVQRVEAWAESEGRRLSEKELEKAQAFARARLAEALPTSVAVAVGNVVPPP